MQMPSSPLWLDGWLPGRWTLGLAGLGGSLLWPAKKSALAGESGSVCVR